MGFYLTFASTGVFREMDNLEICISLQIREPSKVVLAIFCGNAETHFKKLYIIM